MCSASELFADLFRDRTDIGALTAVDLELQSVAFERGEFVAIDGHNTRPTLHFDAASGQFVQRLSLVLDRREHRRYLLELAAKSLEHGFHRCGIDAYHRPRLDHCSVRVAAVGANAQPDSNPVFLVRVEQELREL